MPTDSVPMMILAGTSFTRAVPNLRRALGCGHPGCACARIHFSRYLKQRQAESDLDNSCSDLQDGVHGVKTR